MPDTSTCDVFVIGGGINGCGIARDAAGRGYSVYLAEMNDLASGTSSWSTKLIHGGLRYLEHYEFRLVREALMEREVLWNMAPHIIWPLRFVLPYHKGMRPAWLLRLGLFLYDHIGGRKELPPTKVLDLKEDEAGRPLKPEFQKAFEYSDCWVNDARLVVLNARDAADRGATIRTRAKVVAAERAADDWKVTVEDTVSGARDIVMAKLMVNAAGPWVDEILANAVGKNDAHNVRLVQGSHIVIKRKFDHDRAYFFQNADGRIFFAIPYETDFTLVGTTDQDYHGEPGDVSISDQEIDYLCEGASSYFREPVGRGDIVWTYSGIRPLYDDGASKAQEATRDYVLKEDSGNDRAPLINIFGGKITTYRRLGESMLEKIAALIGERGKSWTSGAVLPGGDFPATEFRAHVAALKRDYPFLNDRDATRYSRVYGTRARDILGASRSSEQLGRDFGSGLKEAEVRYLIEQEWALAADDILWRRTKLGLKLNEGQVTALEAFMKELLGDRYAQPT
ncbi:glycerol-3-phosphate dehydrogenase [Oricola cellulosilytica]|uniref:Glycerol-3-phosphate dehydrogenase n=1 Tax=Oricola cellulosilytica TaxID=1429082 RepID=A0A4R0PK30_9HYPH|nr:glycerol-3-phosphate dehydrogenase [Oricola cellulosilytica]TCD16680.1 glycerol-3-phosphate dehydrogenase [Oricola cellulosilytica]